MKSKIETIVKDNLCIGCGLCESVCGKENVQMKLDQTGFYKPEVKQIQPEGEDIIDAICPGKNIINEDSYAYEDRIWGKLLKTYSGFSNDKEIRYAGSSGGFISGLSVFVLEHNLVDSVLQVGGDINDYERNELKVSKSRADVLKCASSRYAPALIFDKIFDLLNGSNDNYLFIGKPCDISGLKNFLAQYPQFKDRFKLTVSILCAGQPSFTGTSQIVDEFNAQRPVKNLVYRGSGWPGYFSFEDKEGKAYKRTYNDSWGSTLNRHLNFRCKICPDGIGLQADIAVGDAWETNDGYPDFDEKDGKSLVMVRTQAGQKLVEQALQFQAVSMTEIDDGKIAIMQPYQYQRRRKVAARILAYNLYKGKLPLKFKNLNIYSNLRYESPKQVAKEFLGTARRLFKQ
ncbi:coenzyme F420 hydrogenase subunit beta [Leeuwenhoekiella aestuarii]|uniref:Coenzyme F420 hydrogenase/dehydrogenase, beta subunit C-terminal domain n=1 Tax=Leeuwenhoekiella aestuarii TaxID=2249426 RepID=UPI000FFED5FE|nr:Coenzyme F420 hydrogenase/dehydrogenase, beta subunit C-terminal domain [Leeuwenhoekiella aestuarii]RXG12927.1 coenzyme F420 hydrogenase subunit beta [Leeuwenhoekiella aestuarii]